MNITKDKIQDIIQFLPTYSALYRAHNGAFKTLFVSDKLPGLLGMEKDEYYKVTQDNAVDIVLPQDREGLLAAGSELLTTGKDIDYYYRVISNINGFDWVHIDAHICGEMDGDPVIIARYANMSHEGGVFDSIINNSDRVTIVIDRNNNDVLYANDRVSRLEGYNAGDFFDRKCYSLLKGRTEQCEDCDVTSVDDEELHRKYDFNEETGKWELITWKSITWCMRDAIVIYVQDVTKEKEHEISLDRMNQIYQMAIEDAKEMMWIYDPEMRTITYQVDNPFTREICEKTGMPTVIGNVPESLIGMVDEEYKEEFISMFKVDNLDKQGVKLEYSSTVNGDTQWWRVASRPIYDINGNVKAVFCSGTNITENKRAERNYQSLLAQISDMSKMGIVYSTLNLSKNKLISGSSVYKEQPELLRKDTADEYFSSAIKEIADEEIKNRLVRLFSCKGLIDEYNRGRRQITLEYPVRSQLNGTRGRIKWVKTTNYLIMNPDTGDIENISIVTEITRQKKNEKLLEYIADRGCDYLGLINCSDENVEFYGGVWDSSLANKSEKISYADMMKRLSESSAETDKRKIFEEQIKLENVMAKLTDENEIVVSYDALGDNKKILKKQIKFRWFDDDKVEILVFQDDITEAYAQEHIMMAKLKDALDKANLASEAKTNFLSRMSHDMRTPLNGIIGMTYLTRGMELPKPATDNLDKISKSSEFLLGVINDILDMTKLESSKVELDLEPYPYEDFNSYVDAVIRPLCEGKQQTLILDTDPIEGYVPMTDIKKLNRIYFNLLSNAVKYTPEGGTITFTINEKYIADDRIAFTVKVSDNGIGMSKEFQEHLFEPFTQENRNDILENRGTGLGLSIVKQLVDAFGGTVEVESAPGKGTIFTVKIISPVVKRDYVEAKKEQERNKIKDFEMLAGKRVLLCEDHPLNQEIAKTLLENVGTKVEIAENGKDGLDAFIHSALNYFDCILMDIRMPVLNGVEATKAIRSLERADAKTIPVIAMTADAFKEDVNKCLDAGMNGHIAKPIEPERLYETLLTKISKN